MCLIYEIELKPEGSSGNRQNRHMRNRQQNDGEEIYENLLFRKHAARGSLRQLHTNHERKHNLVLFPGWQSARGPKW